MNMTILERFQKIRLFVFDADGVLTDGSLYVFADGEQVRKMNIKDGFAIQLAIKRGYKVLIISGAGSEGVSKRVTKLGVTDVFMNVGDKAQLLSEFMTKNNFSTGEVLYMGDDMPDHKVMKLAGLACAPANAMPEIKAIAHYITNKNGGEGCVREVIEKVLKINSHWEVQTDVSSR
jgi:3-deoxy-D-manno-octulosonate 8-phosphate phosphatase (KDO 8-P phosphatase)